MTEYYSEIHLSHMCRADCCWFCGCVGVCVCVCVCVCVRARAVSCGMPWIFIFSGGSVLYWSVVVFLFSGLRKGGYGWWVFKRVSKIALGNMVCSSFR